MAYELVFSLGYVTVFELVELREIEWDWSEVPMVPMWGNEWDYERGPVTVAEFVATLGSEMMGKMESM